MVMADMGSPSSSGNTFVVRIWMEWSEIGSSWRGQIEYLQSGKKATFLTLQGMVTFIESHVSMPVIGQELKGGEREDN
jgi:hypothetical protein